MTERKPPDITFESWVDRQIRVAQQRGDFDDLPGTGKPIPPDTGEYEWIRRYAEREQLPTDAMLPTPLRLRRRVERIADEVRDCRSEADVRSAVAELNREIVEHLRVPSTPHIPVPLADIEETVATWRQGRRESAARALAADSPVQRTRRHRGPRRRRWPFRGR
ncbi:DUF1992 domain-containing protein [Rhodococcus rhodnii]|uniref:DnaJ homologue subfamily C member 28 conserved domain-containing protein n=2 Tax=Rhodococcus rhodnii TaxID=38312 RepID=R7WP93_9NOCA|nr:DUF1992 domain-containing protein [Rhodococcus rhodnii]EOM77141.1 hypothetical protein Rrhod_1511 [Rhodococcus rhodnii LMG 5362]TXG92132.1 DUF1992 domain-containing protein [Rhodococcus rhodnii]